MEDITIKQEPIGSEAPKTEAPATATTESRPEWLLSKFKTTEDQAKAYVELEKMKTKSEEAPATTEQPKTETPKDAATEEAAVKAQLAEKKIDFDSLAQEYAANKGLKPESYKALEDAGIPKSVVDDYIGGQVAKADAFNNQMYESVGGQENFAAMIEWAKTSLSPAEIEAYNKSLEGGPDQAKLAVTGLHSSYIKSTGGTPKLIGGSPASGVTGYSSYSQQQRDMQDPKYRTDPAFREEVTRRSLASNF